MAWDLRLAIDAAMVLGYFALIIWIGLSFGRRETSLEGFALGGRRIPWWAVLASIIAAETSAGTFLGTPAEGYALRNFTYLQLVLGTILARFIVAYLFIKPFYDYNVCSIYEFLAVRFGEGTKRLASAVFILTRVLASGTRLYIAAIVLAVAYELLTGARPTASEQLAIYVGAIVVMTLLTAAYTMVGGIKAVIWTDLVQASLMMGSAVLTVGFLVWIIPGQTSGIYEALDGFAQVTFIQTGLSEERDWWGNVRHVLESPYTIWAGLIGATFITMATHGTDQDMVQRMLTAQDYQRSRRSLIWSGVADIPIVLVFLSIGILLSVYYELQPNAALPTKTNEIFPFFILTEMPVVLRGLVIAGVFATAMGSLSAALNALATSFTRDWFLPFRSKAPTEQETVRAARGFTGMFALIMILVASGTAYFVILYPDSRIIPIALGIFGYTYGSLLGVFLVGMITKTRGSDRGNFWAMLAGFLAVSYLSGLHNDLLRLLTLPEVPKPEWMPVLAFPWRICFGTVVTAGVAICFRRSRA